MVVLDNININLIFQFSFSNYFAIIIYTMASLAQQPPQKQQGNQIPPDISPNVAGVVEVFADQEISQLLSPFAAGVQISSEQTLTPRLKEGITNMVYRGDLSAGRSALSMQRGSLTALCQYGLPEDYIASDLFNQAWDDDDETWRRALSYLPTDEDDITRAPTNLILILYDTDQYPQRKIPRGIALCSVNATRMKLLVLGATRPSMAIRNRHYARGGQLLRAVQYLGAMRTYIELYALETVITLYHKFGWRFIDPANCGQGKPGGAAERGHYGEAVKALFKLYKDAGKGEPNEESLTKLLLPFRGFAMGRAGMWRQGKSGAEATEAGRDNGYQMILCQQNNPYIGFVQIILSQQAQGSSSGNSKGGRRRRRKRTKKKALKKKHRRTRRKKKRKTRRRRKRRGGKKKLSRKHCHSLKQQHTRMAHQLHRAGQAIRVQCGMHGGKRNLMPTKISCSIFGEADSCKNVAYKHQKGGDKSCVGAKDGVSGCKTCCGTNSGSCIDHCMK